MNQTVLITGASRGIGREIAISFAKEKDNLYLVCQKNIDELNALAVNLEENYAVSCKTFQGDVGDFGFVEKMFKSIPSIDIVINNAGIAWLGLLSDMSPEEWQHLMNTNLFSLYNTSKFCIPLMLQKGHGRIINISSVWGDVGASCEVAYSASKGGVNAYTKALAKELAPSGISVNAVSCGVIDTDMNRSHLSDDEMEVLKEEIPKGRLGTPMEVAGLVVLVSKAPLYMTGQIITIDGGWQ